MHSRTYGRTRAVLLALVCGALAPIAPFAQATTVYNFGFEDGQLAGWHARGTEVLSVSKEVAHGGSSSLKITNRTTTWHGPQHAIAPTLGRGQTYHISTWIYYDKGPATRSFTLSVERAFVDLATAHQYQNLLAVTANRGQWARIEVDYLVPSDQTLQEVQFYIEVPYKADNLVTEDDKVDFYVDDITVTLPDVSTRLTIQTNIPNLRDAVKGFAVGAAVSPQEIDAADPHFRLITKHFSALVAGNEMKPNTLQPQEGRFSFQAGDAIADLALRTGMILRGHTLVWHNQTPNWFFTDPNDPSKPASRELLVRRLENHIKTVVTHYRGQVASWDVVNEPISETTGLRGPSEGSQWMGIIGPEYIDLAFRAARAADPNAELLINDYNLESNPAKRAEMIELVRGMLSRGVPVDAVGLQMHISLYSPSVAEVRTAIEEISALGVKVQITEMDVSMYQWQEPQLPQKEMTPALLEQQAKLYGELFALFTEYARKGVVTQVVMWGVSDDTSWLNNFPVAGRQNAPLLFDRRLQAKPAFWAIVDPSRPR